MKCPYTFFIPCEGEYKRIVGTLSHTEGLEVPCGKCFICRINRASDWSLRLCHELEYHKDATFLTLTYDDPHLPIVGGIPTVDKTHIKSFIRRFRRSNHIKYFCAAEYGSERYRPHYHLIIFGWRPLKTDIYDLNGRKSDLFINTIWPWGNNCVEPVNEKTIYYTAQYLYKSYLQEDYYTKTAFQLTSNNIGKQYLLDHATEISEQGLYHAGKQQRVPRYYIKLLNKIGLTLQYEHIILNQVTTEAALLRKKINTLPNGFKKTKLQEALNDITKSREKTAIAKHKMEHAQKRANEHQSTRNPAIRGVR